MAIVKGQNLRVIFSIDGEATFLAAATSCVLHIATVIEENTTKDTDDDWIRNEVTGMNWDVETEALVIDANDEHYREGAIAADQLQVGQQYTLTLQHTLGAAGEMNRDQDISPDAPVYAGIATLSDLQFISPNGDHSVARAKFTGLGDLFIP